MDSLESKLARLRRQVKDMNKGGKGTSKGGDSRFGPPPPRPLFRGKGETGPPPRPLFRGHAPVPPPRPFFRGNKGNKGNKGGGKPLFRGGVGGGPAKIPPRYSDESEPPAKRQRAAPKEILAESVILHKVPADYTISTLTELHEAVALDPKSMAAVRFLRASSEEGAATPTRSVVLTYLDESSASHALEVLQGHPVMSETGEMVSIEAELHDAEDSGKDGTENPQDVQEEWNAPVDGEAAEGEEEQPYDPEIDASAIAEQEEAREERSIVSSRQEGGHSLRSSLMRFIRENNVDEDAQDALWELGPEEQDSILREGPCTGANPSAVLMSRIRRLAVERAAYAPPLNPGDVERFLGENGIDNTAGTMLRECDPEIQKRVVAEGSVTGRNPSAIVASRIRRAQHEYQNNTGPQERRGWKGGKDGARRW